MREIKFRVWNTILNKYVEDEDTIIFAQKGTAGRLQWLGNGYMIMIGSEETHIIEQFTGLLDKNGTEIYEGDVVKTSWNEIYTVVFDEYSCSFMLEDEYGVNMLSRAKVVEIIGNIHEATK